MNMKERLAIIETEIKFIKKLLYGLIVILAGQAGINGIKLIEALVI